MLDARNKAYVKTLINKHNKDMENTIKIGEEVIDLNLPFPRMMEVRNTLDGKWEPRMVICISSAGSSGKVVAICDERTVFEASCDLITWELCREISKKKQMTVAEIEAKMGHGVEVIS